MSHSYHSMSSPSPTGTATHSVLQSGSSDAVLQQADDVVIDGRTGGRCIVSNTHLTFQSLKSSTTQTLSHDDIIAAQLSNNSTLTIHAYPYTAGGCCSSKHRQHVQHRIEFSTAAQAQQWQSQLQQLIYAHSASTTALPFNQRHILVLINPAAGSGRAQSTFKTQVEPVLQHSGLRYTVTLTKYAQHAYEICQKMNVLEHDSIVTMGGDGILSEVINGIMHRSDWAEAIQRIAWLGCGGGSGNGLCKSVCEASTEVYDSVSAALLVVKNYRRPIDLFTVAQEGSPVQYGFLSLSWAMISDIDLDSEKYRVFGGARFTLAAIGRLLCIRKYRAMLEYIEAPTEAAAPAKSTHRRDAMTARQCAASTVCNECSPVKKHTSDGPTQQDAMADYVTQWEATHGTTKVDSDKLEVRVDHAVGTSTKANDEQWQRVDDDFTLLWAMNVPHAASDMHVAPSAHISDGYLDLLYTPAATTTKLVPFLLGIDSGSHVDSSLVEYIKVKAFRLTPMASRRSELVIDGERLPYAPIEVRCWRAVGTIFAK